MTVTNPLPTPLIPLDSPVFDIGTVGGKGANLVRLVNAGFQVPPGFIIPTTAYQEFTSENQLFHQIRSIVKDVDPSSPDELERASQKIRSKFSEGKVSAQLRDALETGWKWLDQQPVAVRSSATAEDLPYMSFAGQQDTYLNVRGNEALLEAVVKCWSSLWTARAIGYRTRNQIPHNEVSLSVIVQQMVQSQSSGVLFTANPLTGLRTEVVIDATFGLGEALVSGQVEPDHYIVDMESKNIREKFLGSKLVSIESVPDGGVQTTTQGASDLQAVPDDVIHQLATTGEQIEKVYDFPQDIEWAWADDKIYILQSRPITSLFPIPVVSESDQLHVYFSFGAVQGLLEPMTPLGQDAIRLIFAGGSSLFGFENRNQHTQGVIKIAGDRLWGDMTGVIRHPIGAKLAPKVFPGVEPGSLNALEQILSDPKIAAGSGQLRFRTFVRLIKFGLRMLRRMIHFARHPEDKANEIEQAYQDNILLLEEKYRPAAGKANDLETNIKLFREIYYAFPYAVPEIMGGALPGLIPLLALSKFSKELHGSNDLAMELTRGLPNNVTTKMDLALWDTAKTIKANATAYDVLKSTPAEDLSQQYLQNQLPDQAQNAIGEFLTQYGMRGLGEIDIGRPRWCENPTQILKTIQSYLHIEDESLAPDAVFHRGEIQAEKALETLKSLASQTFGGKFKAKMIEALVRRLRALGGLRESPKFYIIQMMGIMRQSMLDLGQELVTQGKLTQPDDLFFLYLDELEDFSKGELTEWELLIRQRRDSYNREMLRKQIPRMLVSDGRTFYEGMTTHDLEDGSFKGSPVSPGVVEGTVKIVFNPHQAHLLPGEILVCPGTDPAWTPLFLAASGLVMEVGGLMTHGAIVAREYGIPAVVGVNQATEIFHDGDRIRINGSTGLIEKIG